MINSLLVAILRFAVKLATYLASFIRSKPKLIDWTPGVKEDDSYDNVAYRARSLSHIFTLRAQTTPNRIFSWVRNSGISINF